MKSMELFFIVVLLAGGTQALIPVDETTCDLRTSTCPCSPLLKGTVYVQVMTDASGREVTCLKMLPTVNIIVFNLKKETITIDKEFYNRLQFLIRNGTIKITNLRRNDSGQYNIEVFNSGGVREKNINFTLDVKGNDKVESKISHSFPYLRIVFAALGSPLIAVSCCVVYRELKHLKKTSNKAAHDQKSLRCETENINLKCESEL
ncbi:fibroblast growth factor 23 [Sarotherodon galilaeus]